jgi:hypothetical protein
MRRTWIGLLCLVLPGLVFSASELKFDSSGRPSTLILGGQDLLSSSPSEGFVLRQSTGKNTTETRLSQISASGDTLHVSDPDGEFNFTFEVDTYPHHLAIHLLDAQGIGSGHGYSLSLDLGSTEIAAYTLNDYMKENTGNRRRRSTELSWPTLWAWPRPNGTLGSVVLYDHHLSGSELDAVLAEIWSVQSLAGHMVRPAGQPRWSEADVLAWVERWVEKFKAISRVSLGPESEKELYEMTDKWVIPSGATRVYMFSTIWRGEYHIFDLTNESVEGKAFPKGKESLLKYSDYLAKHGAHLQLKSLVPHLGRNDERYFSESHCETRFLSWGSGTLVNDIDSNAQTILFKPGPDYVWEQEEGFVRIETEMIHADKITIDAGRGEWILAGCERGYAGTSPHAHKAGVEVAGVSSSYSFFHHADDFGQPNSLAEEMLNPYADFLNEMNVGHIHFDGTGYKEEAPWFLRNYTDYVYSRQDQPVTGSVVGGGIDANFEKMFPMAAQAVKASSYYDIRIGVRLHGMGRGSERERRNFAPNLLDINFDISDLIANGARRPNFGAGRSSDSLTLEMLEKYGLVDVALALYKDWVVLAPVYDDADEAYVKRFLKKRSGSSHYEGEDSLVLSKNRQGEYIYTPHRIMGRTSGEDEKIFIDQEWGAIPRYQEIKAGTTMDLFNPYDAQMPQVVICVEDTSTALKNPVIKVNGPERLTVTGEIQPGEYMTYEEGSKAQVYDSNWNKLRELRVRRKLFEVKNGVNQVSVEAGRGSDEPTIKVQFITLGPEYVLESNKNL